MGGLLSKGVQYKADGMTVKQCLFCDICVDKPKMRQTAIAYEDARVVVFAPLEKAALEHWLVVPRQHIRNAATLKRQDLPLLAYMKEKGLHVLREKKPGGDYQFCFHVEPFNSIAHLHLHAMALPFQSTVSQWKYQVGTRWCWDYERVRERLEKGESIS